jgi:nucleoside-diphosphate-sugar epimerase
MGGTAFFGKRIVSMLISRGYKVTVATRGHRPNPFGDEVEQVQFERKDLESMRRAFGNSQFDIVYDQIGFAPDDMADSVEVFSGKINHYVFTSSAAVYDSGTNIAESDLDPMSIDPGSGRFPPMAYGDGKRQAEAFLLQKAPFPVAIARMPFIIGPDDTTKRFQTQVQRVIDRLPIVVPQPCGKVPFLDADDAGEFVAWLGLEGKTGPYNAVSANADAVEIIKRIGAILGVDPIITNEGEENVSPYYYSRDISINASKAISEGYHFSDFDEWFPRVTREVANSLHGQ